MIRRCHESQKSQIQWFNPKTGKTEWVDLINFRYGMSEEEVADEIRSTGISEEQWRLNGDLTKNTEIAIYNYKKNS